MSMIHFRLSSTCFAHLSFSFVVLGMSGRVSATGATDLTAFRTSRLIRASSGDVDILGQVIAGEICEEGFDEGVAFSGEALGIAWGAAFLVAALLRSSSSNLQRVVSICIVSVRSFFSVASLFISRRQASHSTFTFSFSKSSGVSARVALFFLTCLGLTFCEEWISVASAVVGTGGVWRERGDGDEGITIVGEGNKGEKEVKEFVGDGEGMDTRGTYGLASQLSKVGTTMVDGMVAGKEYVTAGRIIEEFTAGGGISGGTEEQAKEVKEMIVGTVVDGQRESRAKVLLGGQ